jgi:hypothetical protein
MSPQFAIGEWLLCPECGMTCDAPFRPAGSEALQPELVLGWSLPQEEQVPLDRWEIEVAAPCPRCGFRITGLAAFEGRLLVDFHATSKA